MFARVVYLGIFVGLLAAENLSCTVVRALTHSTVESVPYTQSEAGTVDGTLYFLPKKLVKLTVDYTPRRCGLHNNAPWLCTLLCCLTKTKVFDVDLRLEVLPAQPDIERGYFASLNHHLIRKDDLLIQTGPEGLLRAVKWDSESQLGAALVQLSKGALNAARIVSTATIKGTKSELENLSGDFDPLKSLHYEVIFDPSCDAPTCSDSWLSVNRTQQLFRLTCKKATAAGENAGSHHGRVEGIVYRRPLPYLVEILKRDASTATLSEIVLLPNRGPEVVIPMSSNWFVRTTHELEFEDGLLTQMRVDQPSEVLGFISIPAEILAGLAEPLIDILPIRIQYSSEDEARAAQAEAITLAPAGQYEIGPGGDGQIIVVPPGKWREEEPE